MILFLKKHFQYFIIVILVIMLLFPKYCNKDNVSTRDKKIIIPEVIDSISKPIVINNYPPKKDSVIYKKGKTIYTENPINKKMAQELIQALKDQDSLKVLKLYLSSIEEREQIRIFNDKNLNIEVYTKVRGQLLDQKISKYIINEKEVKTNIEIKESNFAIYAGGNFQYNSDIKITPNIQLGVQIGKRLIITGGYGLDKSYQAGVLYKIKL